jgi:hypothetical protein
LLYNLFSLPSNEKRLTPRKENRKKKSYLLSPPPPLPPACRAADRLQGKSKSGHTFERAPIRHWGQPYRVIRVMGKEAKNENNFISKMPHLLL